MQWLRQHHPDMVGDTTRSSKLHPKQLWWFTLPSEWFDTDMGYLNMLLQQEEDGADFYFLRVPFSFFADNQGSFDVRGEEFDLHISARQHNLLQDTRGTGRISFAEFLQE